MKNLIPKERRHDELIRFGAPKEFIENIGKIQELKYNVENVDGAYYYLPTIADYNILKGLNIIPIYDEAESFTMFGYNDDEQKIFHFELENNQIYREYGTNWSLLLFDIMFQYFENNIDDINSKAFLEVGKKIGFIKAEQLFKLLNVPSDKYPENYSQIQKWKKELVKKLKVIQ